MGMVIVSHLMDFVRLFQIVQKAQKKMKWAGKKMGEERETGHNSVYVCVYV